MHRDYAGELANDDPASVIRFPAGNDRRPQRCRLCDPGEMISTHGYVMGWLKVWRCRTQQRRALMDLAENQPDAVLDDVGIDRRVALREASKWFWQDFSDPFR